MAKSYVRWMLKLTIVFQSSCTIYISFSSVWEFNFLSILSDIWYDKLARLFNFKYSNRIIIFFIVTLICMSLVTNDIENLFMYSFVIYIFSLWIICSHILCTFLLDSWFVYYWIIWVLHIFWMQVICWVYVLSILPPSLLLAFHFFNSTNWICSWKSHKEKCQAQIPSQQNRVNNIYRIKIY